MTIVNDGSAHGIGQYRFPHNYELAGRKFSFEAREEKKFLGAYVQKIIQNKYEENIKLV